MTALHRNALFATLLMALSLVGGCASPDRWRGDEGKAHELVNKATLSLLTLGEQAGDRPLQDALRGACAVFVFPAVASASFVVGAAAGSGILMMKESTSGRWTGPAFYAMTEISMGVDVGATRRDTVIVLHRCDALNDTVQANVGIGVGATLALAHRSAAIAVLSKDMRAFSRASGVQVGVALDGVLLRPRQALADAYYGTPLTPAEILARPAADDSTASELRQTIFQATQ